MIHKISSIKKSKDTSVDENVEKRESFYTIDRKVSGTAIMNNSLEFP
jgi:hypothetical protein